MSYLLEESKSTPKIDFNTATLEFSLEGKCYPENSKMFFTPIIEWCNNWSYNGENTLKIDFYLDYISSSSVLSILNLLKLLNDKSKGNLTILWRYDEDDDEMLSVGKDFSKLINLPFSYQEVEE